MSTVEVVNDTWVITIGADDTTVIDSTTPTSILVQTDVGPKGDPGVSGIAYGYGPPTSDVLGVIYFDLTNKTIYSNI